MRVLSAAHSYGYFDFVARRKEFLRLLSLNVKVAYVDRHGKPNLFKFNYFLILLRFFRLFKLLELKFTVVHNLAYGGNGVGRDFNKVQIFIVSKAQRFLRADYAELLARFADKPYFSVANFFVDLMLVFNNDLPSYKKLRGAKAPRIKSELSLINV